MNIREIVESQITQGTRKGSPVSGNAQFALLMSLFSQPGPALIDTSDQLNQHEVHAVNRPIRFSHNITANPGANIALLKALGQEPLAVGTSTPYNPVESVNALLALT